MSASGDYLSVPEAARRLGIAPGTLRAMIADGQIAALPVGTGKRRPRLRLRPEWLDEYLARRVRPAKRMSVPAIRPKRVDRRTARPVPKVVAPDWRNLL